MSKVAKGIGRVFKKVGKVALKVLPFALAAAAVVFTGGAALGLLPAFSTVVGGLVGGLGLGTALTGAITGSIVSAGFGSAIGLVTGGTKGGTRGMIAGALTGGLLGAVSPATFGIGGASTAGTAAANTASTSGMLQNQSLAATLGGNSVGPGLDVAGSALTAPGVVPGVAATTTGAITAAPAVAAAGGASRGFLGFLNQNPALASSMFNGISTAFTPSGASESGREARRMGEFAYGGSYDGSNPFGVSDYGRPPEGVRASQHYQPRRMRWVWDPRTSSVVEQEAN